MGDKDLGRTYEELVSDVMDAIGCISLPSPIDGWVEHCDLIIEGKKRGLSARQVHLAILKSIEASKYERVKHGRRIFYREIKTGA